MTSFCVPLLQRLASERHILYLKKKNCAELGGIFSLQVMTNKGLMILFSLASVIQLWLQINQAKHYPKLVSRMNYSLWFHMESLKVKPKDLCVPLMKQS